ncbi:MAG: hypothetical protein AAFX52_10830 [Pseudomonadota bacterium]
MTRCLTIILTALVLIPLTSWANENDTPTELTDMLPVLTEAEALEQWDRVFEVFSHPRCANCHVPSDNRPRWSGPSYGLEEGEWSYHGMNINGGDARDGRDSIPCAACHATSNSELPHGPPGAPHWALAPVEMVWWEQTSKQICEQIKDLDRNGGRTLEEVAAHIDHDALVHWGWEPGPGREPAPYSIKETVDSFTSWAQAGAPCPAE